jgi:hypothetical protein
MRNGANRSTRGLIYGATAIVAIMLFFTGHSIDRKTVLRVHPNPQPAALQYRPPARDKHIALVTLFYGNEMPWYANYFVESCGSQQSGVDCLIVQISGNSTNDVAPHPSPETAFACRRKDDVLPSNVLLLHAGLPAFHSLLRRRTGLDFFLSVFALPDPRKFADLKPLIGNVLGTPWLAPYAIWGWVDLDMVLGDVAAFVDRAAATVVAGSSSIRAPGVAMWGWPAAVPGAAASPSLPWDVWTSTFEGTSHWPVIAGQFTLFRNSPALAGLWRRVPTVASPATQGVSRRLCYHT